MDTLTPIALVLLSLATLTAVATCLYLYRWRRLLTEDGRVLTIPEELIVSLNGLAARVSHLQSTLESAATTQYNSLAALSTNVERADQSVRDILESSTTLQNALDKRDAEIERYREGYDAELTRRALLRFVRVKSYVRAISQTSNQSQQILAPVIRLLDDTLDECGVEEFSPPTGQDYRSAQGVADQPRMIPTDDPNLDYKVAQVFDPGFRFSYGEKTVLVPAQVSIYRKTN